LVESAEAASLVEANANFYRAFESLDPDRMAQVWHHGEGVRCIHPGGPLLSGWDDVFRSWKVIFQNSPPLQFVISDLSVQVERQIGWVSCTENLIQVTVRGPTFSSILATNAFRKVDGEWRMIMHHASPVLRT
jgi:ketosteroid isomerase-like protein